MTPPREKTAASAGPKTTEGLNTRTAYRIGFLAALGFFTASLLVSTILLARSVIVLLIISAFLAVGLNPVVELLERRGLPRGRAVGVVLAGVLLAFAGFLIAIVPPIIDQTSALVTNGPDYLDNLLKNGTVHDLDERFHIIEKAKEAINWLRMPR